MHCYDMLPIYNSRYKGGVYSPGVWEHAYMTAWRENRSGYADAYLRQLDWDAVSAFLLEASEGKHRY